MCQNLVERALDRITGSRAIGNNRVRLLKDATENYPAWLDAIGAARRRIHFENYILADSARDSFFSSLPTLRLSGPGSFLGAAAS